MKNYLLLFLSGWLMAAPVSLNDAQRVAEQIYLERSISSSQINISSVDLIQQEDLDLIFVFNLEPAGFILVPADDRAVPALAYSFESDFSLEESPANLEYLFNLYKSEISAAIENDLPSQPGVLNQWENYLSGVIQNFTDRDVGPLLTAHFDQGSGWNNMCPEDPAGPGGNALVGCVAVSMAQVMHYWSYPTQGNDDNGYYCNPYGWLEADFGATTYDYENMPNNYGTEASQLLLYHAGVAVNMDYGPDGSGAWVVGSYPSAYHAMKNFFLYRNTMDYIYPSQYSDEEYAEILKEELENNRPIIYRGYSDAGGHAWNVDGYEGEQFHCNWGWGGYMNGYFSLSSLGGFSSDQAAVVKIEPQSLEAPNLVLQSYSTVEIVGDSDNIINPGENFMLIINLANMLPWSAANNIDIILESPTSDLEIQNEILFQDYIAEGGEFSNENDPFIIEVNPDIQLGVKDLNLYVFASGDNGAFFEGNYEMQVPVNLNQAGFPVETSSTPVKASPLIADLDNDGVVEIIIGDQNGVVHLITPSGEEIVNGTFPFDTGDDIFGSPAAGNLTGNDELEFVVTSKSESLYIFNKNELINSIFVDEYILATPVLADVDGDEELEIVFGTYTNSGKLYAVEIDGSNIDGFPVNIDEKIKAGVAITDFDQNGKADLILGTYSGNLFKVLDDGSIDDSFTYQTNDHIQIDPVILEYFDDPIIFAGSDDEHFYALNSTGEELFNIDAESKISTSASFLEDESKVWVFFGTNNGDIYSLDIDGNPKENFPIDTGSKIIGSVSFADLDADGSAEIIGSTSDGNFRAFHLDGTAVVNFPIQHGVSLNSSTYVTDIDGDNDLELLAGDANGITAVDVKTAGVEGYWHMFKGNMYRDGCYILNQLMGDVNGDGMLDILDIVRVINHIIGTSMLEGVAFEMADMNSDGVINILDVVAIVSVIIN